MYLNDYIKRFCVIPSQMAKQLAFHPQNIFRIIRQGMIPSLSVALRIEDFTEGKVTARDIYNECINLKEKKKQRNQQRQEKHGPKPKE